MSAADLQARLRDVDEQNALIIRRQAADRLDLYEATIVDLRDRVSELEAELERLTVGRATLEDQTNRAEAAEARADALETALQEIAHLAEREKYPSRPLAQAGIIAREVLSGVPGSPAGEKGACL